MSTASDPHAGQPVITAGAPLHGASGAVVLLHGRGAGAENMIQLFDTLAVDNIAALAPQAAGNTWYPQSFLAPIEQNQPYLDSALRLIATIIDELLNSGIASERIALLGFSQGACLSSEFVIENPRRYGGVMALTGGFIGPPGTVPSPSGSLEGTPVFLGTSDPDAHVPVERVEATRDIMTSMGASVDYRRYPGMPHTVNNEELDVCRRMLRSLSNASPDSSPTE